MSKTLVIIPTFNEAENIADIVGRVRSSVPAVDVLIADDNSPDGTGDRAEVLARDAQVFVLHRTAKNGLGAAYIAGFAWGMDRGYETFVEMDADGSHRPEELPALLTASERGADVVIGSRWITGGSVVNWPRRRKILSRGGNIYVRLMLGFAVHDATGGYRVYKRRTLVGLNLHGVESQGYCFQVDLTRRAVAAGFAVTEVPITFVERIRGESKMSGPIVREALWRVTLWGLRHRYRQLSGSLCVKGARATKTHRDRKTPLC